MSFLKTPPIYCDKDASELLDPLECDNTILLRGKTVASFLPAPLQKFPDYEITRADLSVCIDLLRNLDAGQRNSDVFNTIVVGGGSVLDVAKICFRTNLKELVEKYGGSLTISILRKEIEPRENGNGLLIAVPSVSGSGSEASSVSVLMDSEQKYPFKMDSLLPDGIIYFPDLISHLPQRLMVSGLFDALCHAFEGAMSPIALELFLKTHILVIWRIYSYLKSIENKESTYNGTDALWLSTQAGVIQSSASAGLVHAISHAMEFYHRRYNHGSLIASFFIPVMKFNLERNDKFLVILNELSLSKNEFFSTLEKLIKRFEFEKPDYNVNDELVMRIMKDPCTRTNCRAIKKGDVYNLLEKCRH